MSREAEAKEAGEYWDTLQDWRQTMPVRSRWNESLEIIRDQNERICGQRLDGENQGLIALFKAKAAGELPLRNGISVGCGTGAKEMRLIQAGIVSKFDLCDVSEQSLKIGMTIAEEWGLTDKVSFLHGNAFERVSARRYDLVYWDNSLHHMFDANAAVAWSKEALSDGGWLLMTDFVGANRFQWPISVRAVATGIRGVLPPRYFVNPIDPQDPFPRGVPCPTLEDMEFDPSEAADSEAIIPAIKRHFPNAFIKHIGGTVYHLALNDILTNIPEDSRLLQIMLRLDRFTSFIPHYAIAVAKC